MSIISVSKDGRGDEYYTPRYVVDVIVPHLKKNNFKTIWCPADKESSEYVKVLKEEGFKVIHSHIDEGKDMLEWYPDKEFDCIVTNPPFSLKKELISRLNKIGKPYAILLSATVIQASSMVRLLNEAKDMFFILFDKRISYSGDRPPFPSWYFTSQILDNNEFYIYEKNPKLMYREWEIENNLKVGDKVVLRDDLEDGKKYGELIWKDCKRVGHLLEVSTICDGYFMVDGHCYLYSYDMVLRKRG